MSVLDVDTARLVALQLPISELSVYCRLHSTINKAVCCSETFWRLRYRQDMSTINQPEHYQTAYMVAFKHSKEWAYAASHNLDVALQRILTEHGFKISEYFGIMTCDIPIMQISFDRAASKGELIKFLRDYVTYGAPRDLEQAQFIQARYGDLEGFPATAWSNYLHDLALIKADDTTGTLKNKLNMYRAAIYKYDALQWYFKLGGNVTQLQSAHQARAVKIYRHLIASYSNRHDTSFQYLGQLAMLPGQLATLVLSPTMQRKIFSVYINGVVETDVTRDRVHETLSKLVTNIYPYVGAQLPLDLVMKTLRAGTYYRNLHLDRGDDYKVYKTLLPALTDHSLAAYRFRAVWEAQYKMKDNQNPSAYYLEYDRYYYMTQRIPTSDYSVGFVNPNKSDTWYTSILQPWYTATKKQAFTATDSYILVVRQHIVHGVQAMAVAPGETRAVQTPDMSGLSTYLVINMGCGVEARAYMNARFPGKL